MLASEGQFPARVWQNSARSPTSVTATLKSPYHSYLTVLISCLALASNWLIMSFWMCKFVRAPVAECCLEPGGPSGLFMWSKQCGHCGRGRRGHGCIGAGPPSNRTFSRVQSKGHRLNVLNKTATAAAHVCQLCRTTPEVPAFVEVSLLFFAPFLKIEINAEYI